MTKIALLISTFACAIGLIASASTLFGLGLAGALLSGAVILVRAGFLISQHPERTQALALLQELEKVPQPA